MERAGIKLRGPAFHSGVLVLRKNLKMIQIKSKRQYKVSGPEQMNRQGRSMFIRIFTAIKHKMVAMLH